MAAMLAAMDTTTAPIAPHPDRLLPADPDTRSVARRIHRRIADLPIVSPHGHVDPRLLLDDEPFRDPVSLFVTPDHYVTRLLHASGVDLADLGVGRGPLDEAGARAAWRLLCHHWPVFRGTPVRYWLEVELAEVLGVDVPLSPATADASFDAISERLDDDDFRPRALYERFGIEVLATTDDPADDLATHAALADDDTFDGRVIPTFRPDRHLEAGGPGWTTAMAELGVAVGRELATSEDLLAALWERRRHFIAHGATSADHSHPDVRTDELGAGEADRIHAAALAGEVTREEAVAYRRHLLGHMARMSAEDGLVMTLHPGVVRNHHQPTFEAFGPDTGHDLPLPGEFTRSLQPMLNRHGTDEAFRVVLFTLDETTWSRELAPLAGFYPSVFVGAPWWFHDAPEAIRRFRAAVTASAGFSRMAGFIDDTRAFCSIPARHDMARRIDAGFLAGLVTEHRLGEDEAVATAIDLTVGRPREVFRL